MNELTLEGLLEAGQSDFVKNEANWLVVEVSAFGAEVPEVIVNFKENIKAKLKYYSEAYNDDLTLKGNNNIKIVEYTFLEDISGYFG